MQSNTVEKITNTTQALRAMQGQIDIDAARAALACAKAEDADLMRQLVYALSPERDFIPCLTGMQKELESRSYIGLTASKVAEYHDVLATAVKDQTSAMTNDLEVESDERLSLFALALRRVPSSSLHLLASDMLQHFQQQQQDGVYRLPSGSDADHLRLIQEISETIG